MFVIEKLAEIYQSRIDEMAKAISMEMGAPMKLATNAQAVWSCAFHDMGDFLVTSSMDHTTKARLHHMPDRLIPCSALKQEFHCSVRRRSMLNVLHAHTRPDYIQSLFPICSFCASGDDGTAVLALRCVFETGTVCSVSQRSFKVFSVMIVPKGVCMDLHACSHFHLL